jgi:uncharacterized repeat protein (TIGR03803 family)
MRLGIWAALAAAGIIVAGAGGSAQAGQLKPVYSFCVTQVNFECVDGSAPTTLTVDAAGNLFGTTLAGGDTGWGTVFELVPDAQHTSWTYHRLYSFCPAQTSCPDGSEPEGTLVIGTDGTIYGTTMSGGSDVRQGVAYALTPNAQHTAYTYGVLHTFCVQNCADGAIPGGGLTYFGASTGAAFDKKSRTPLYGVTAQGGSAQQGVLYSLTLSHGKWKEEVVHNFCTTDCLDGASPTGAMTFTAPNTMVGVTFTSGAAGGGVVYQAASNAKGNTWKIKPLFSFDGNSPSQTGDGPTDGAILGTDGAYYGTTSNGTPNFKGALYKLQVHGKKATYSLLYAFCQAGNPNCNDGAVPIGLPVMDASGNIYGTARSGGGHNGNFSNFGAGAIWKFDTKTATYSVAHAFCSAANCADGDTPSGLVMDGSGNLFGVTNNGGGTTFSSGMVYEYTP